MSSPHEWFSGVKFVIVIHGNNRRQKGHISFFLKMRERTVLGLQLEQFSFVAIEAINFIVNEG